MFRGSLLTADDPPLSPSRFRGGASGPERTPGRRLFLPPGLSVAPCLPASHALPVRLLFPSPALRPIVQGSDLCLVLFRPSLPRHTRSYGLLGGQDQDSALSVPPCGLSF